MYRILQQGNIKLKPVFCWPGCVSKMLSMWSEILARYRNVGMSENLGGHVVMWGGHNLPPSGWDRVNWFVKIWECHSTPGSYRPAALNSLGRVSDLLKKLCSESLGIRDRSVQCHVSRPLLQKCGAKISRPFHLWMLSFIQFTFSKDTFAYVLHDCKLQWTHFWPTFHELYCFNLRSVYL